MDFSLSQRQQEWRDHVRGFIQSEITPALKTCDAQMAAFGAERWKNLPILEELKAKARARLVELFLPPSPEHDTPDYRGAGLSNLDYALCAEEMGRIHHCTRTIGTAEVALEAMTKRLLSRTAFGKLLSEQSVWEERVADARIGEPDDIAGAAVFLASSASRFMTGQSIIVDGGATISSGLLG